MSILGNIKRDAQKSGNSKGKFIYFREGQKIRVRFLQDMDDGMEIKFHDSFELGINVPCQEIFGRDCSYCEQEGIRTRSQYIWSVWNYDAKEVQLFMFPVNQCTPIPAIVSMYEEYGTLTDRDYVISVQGKQQNKAFSVVPMDKVKFRNAKVKPFTENQVLKLLDKAFPNDEYEEELDEDEEDEKPKTKKRPPKKQGKKKVEDDDDDYDDEFEDDEDGDEEDNFLDEYEKKKNVKSKKSKPADDEDDGDDEDYEDEVDSEEYYDDMSAKELYKLCKKRKISVEPGKAKRYYVRALEEADEAEDEWEDED